MTEKSSVTGNGLVKFTPEEKADIANAIDQAIASSQVTASRQKDEGIKLALQARVERMQKLFIKVRQEL